MRRWPRERNYRQPALFRCFRRDGRGGGNYTCYTCYTFGMLWSVVDFWRDVSGFSDWGCGGVLSWVDVTIGQV